MEIRWRMGLRELVCREGWGPPAKKLEGRQSEVVKAVPVASTL